MCSFFSPSLQNDSRVFTCTTTILTLASFYVLPSGLCCSHYHRKRRFLRKCSLPLVHIAKYTRSYNNYSKRTGLECTITISKLSPGQTWWFFSCNKCNKKSLPEGKSYRCSSCYCKAAKPRYYNAHLQLQLDCPSPREEKKRRLTNIA